MGKILLKLLLVIVLLFVEVKVFLIVLVLFVKDRLRGLVFFFVEFLKFLMLVLDSWFRKLFLVWIVLLLDIKLLLVFKFLL